MSGKCTMGAGGVTMLLGLIATIMAGVSIKLTFNTEKLNKCRDSVYPSGCARRALSEVSAGAHTNSINSKWSAEFLSAVRRALVLAAASLFSKQGIASVHHPLFGRRKPW